MAKLNRREFLGTAVAGAVAAPGVMAAAAESPAEKKLRLGLIGCGWYGMVDVQAALKAGGVEIVAICDVDGDHLKASADKVEQLQTKRPATHKLYEEMLKAGGMDAVIIASPPHWHALQFIAAVEKGLDVYCEKPLAYDIREGRAMVDAARKSGRTVQIGFQRRQAGAIQQVRKYIQDGNAGRIVQVDAQIHYQAGLKDVAPQDPPPALDWDLWCGPGPKIPYSPQVGHFNWRLEKTSGHGHLVDWGIHLIDATRWILDEKMPKTVQAAGGIYYHKEKITTPDILTVHFDFERCPVTWRHRISGAEEYAPEVSNGIFFYGEKETVFVTDDKWTVIPRGKGKDRKTNQAGTDAGTLHMADFLRVVRQNRSAVAPAGLTSCPIEEGYASTATVKLAMIAYETGSKITWDAAGEQIVGNAEAAKLLKREYRAPWKHPG